MITPVGSHSGDISTERRSVAFFVVGKRRPLAAPGQDAGPSTLSSFRGIVASTLPRKAVCICVPGYCRKGAAALPGSSSVPVGVKVWCYVLAALFGAAPALGIGLVPLVFV